MVYKNGNYVCTINGKPCTELAPKISTLWIGTNGGSSYPVRASAYDSADNLLTSWSSTGGYVSSEIVMRKGEQAKVVVEQDRRATYVGNVSTTGIQSPTSVSQTDSSTRFTGYVNAGENNVYLSGVYSAERYTAAGSGMWNWKAVENRPNPSWNYIALLALRSTYSSEPYTIKAWTGSSPQASLLNNFFYTYSYVLDFGKFYSISVTATANGLGYLTAGPSADQYMKVRLLVESGTGGYSYVDSLYVPRGATGMSGTLTANTSIPASVNNWTRQPMQIHFHPSGSNSGYINEPGNWEFTGIVR